MQSIEIQPSYNSPAVSFSALDGKLTIEGKSILMDVEEFYRPLLDWLDAYISQESPKGVEFTFDIEYFNLASTKRFMFFLIKLKALKDEGKEVTVNWLYASNDKDVFEMGQDLSQMLELDFNFVAYEKLKEAVVEEK